MNMLWGIPKGFPNYECELMIDWPPRNFKPFCFFRDWSIYAWSNQALIFLCDALKKCCSGKILSFSFGLKFPFVFFFHRSLHHRANFWILPTFLDRLKSDGFQLRILKVLDITEKEYQRIRFSLRWLQC